MSLLKIPYIHTVYIWFWPTLYMLYMTPASLRPFLIACLHASLLLLFAYMHPCYHCFPTCIPVPSTLGQSKPTCGQTHRPSPSLKLPNKGVNQQGSSSGFQWQVKNKEQLLLMNSEAPPKTPRTGLAPSNPDPLKSTQLYIGQQILTSESGIYRSCPDQHLVSGALCMEAFFCWNFQWKWSKVGHYLKKGPGSSWSLLEEHSWTWHWMSLPWGMWPADSTEPHTCIKSYGYFIFVHVSYLISNTSHPIDCTTRER